jgi:hypothetical protein
MIAVVDTAHELRMPSRKSKKRHQQLGVKITPLGALGLKGP